MAQQPDMVTTLRYDIAGIVIGLDASSPIPQSPIARIYAPFTTDRVPNLALKVHYDVHPTLNICNQVFETGKVWRIYRVGSHLVFSVGPPKEAPYQISIFQKDFREGEIYYPDPTIQPMKSRFPLAPPLGQLIVIGRLSQGYGTLLHACGVKVDGRGLLFVGTDNAGKTSIGRLWEQHAGATTLGDDQIIVRKQGQEYWMYSTPWRANGSFVGSAPVEAVYVIHHGIANKITPLSPVQATAQLVKRSFSAMWSPEGMSFTVEMLSEIGIEMPVYDYAFVPDRSAVDFVQCLSA